MLLIKRQRSKKMGKLISGWKALAAELEDGAELWEGPGGSGSYLCCLGASGDGGTRGCLWHKSPFSRLAPNPLSLGGWTGLRGLSRCFPQHGRQSAECCSPVVNRNSHSRGKSLLRGFSRSQAHVPHHAGCCMTSRDVCSLASAPGIAGRSHI